MSSLKSAMKLIFRPIIIIGIILAFTAKNNSHSILKNTTDIFNIVSSKQNLSVKNNQEILDIINKNEKQLEKHYQRAFKSKGLFEKLNNNEFIKRKAQNLERNFQAISDKEIFTNQLKQKKAALASDEILRQIETFQANFKTSFQASFQEYNNKIFKRKKLLTNDKINE